MYVHWRRQWHPTPALLPGKSHGRRSLVGCSPWGRQELDTTERLPFHFSLSCIGEGNGNPLQCSYLENPRDGGALWAAVSGVAQSWTWLKWLSSSSIHPRIQPSLCPLRESRSNTPSSKKSTSHPNFDSKYHSGLNGTRDSWRNGQFSDPSRERIIWVWNILFYQKVRKYPPVRRHFKKIQKIN